MISATIEMLYGVQKHAPRENFEMIGAISRISGPF